MTVTVDWDNEEKTVICYEFTGHWTWAELGAAVDKRDEMMIGIGYPVGIIVDLRRSGKLPPGMLTNVRHLLRGHPLIEHVAIVGASPVIIGLMNLLGRIARGVYMRYRYYFILTIEDARKMLAEIRQLPGQEAPDGNDEQLRQI